MARRPGRGRVWSRRFDGSTGPRMRHRSTQCLRRKHSQAGVHVLTRVRAHARERRDSRAPGVSGRKLAHRDASRRTAFAAQASVTLARRTHTMRKTHDVAVESSPAVSAPGRRCPALMSARHAGAAAAQPREQATRKSLGAAASTQLPHSMDGLGACSRPNCVHVQVLTMAG